MRGIEDCRFRTDPQKDGRFVGRVEEFPNIRTRPYASRLDALDEVINLTSERIRDIRGRMGA